MPVKDGGAFRQLEGAFQYNLNELLKICILVHKI